MPGFWGIVVKPNSSKQAEIIPNCVLTANNVALASGLKGDLFVRIDEEERFLVTSLNIKTNPQYRLNLQFGPGQSVMFTNTGDGEMHITGFISEIPDEDECGCGCCHGDEDEDEDEEDFDESDVEKKAVFGTSSDEDEEEEEEEEPPAKKQKKIEQPKKQQPAQKKPEPKKPEQKKPAQQQKPQQNGGEFFCKECNRKFKSAEGLASHNKDKHHK